MNRNVPTYIFFSFRVSLSILSLWLISRKTRSLPSSWIKLFICQTTERLLECVTKRTIFCIYDPCKYSFVSCGTREGVHMEQNIFKNLRRDYFQDLHVLFRQWFPQAVWWLCGDGQWQTGSGFSGLNSNLGGVQVQQQGHMHGHLHCPGGVFSLQHSQAGLLTLAPKTQGNVIPGQHPVLHPQLTGG